MSLFDENITKGHPFDGVQSMDPIEGLNYVYKAVSGQDFSDITSQYKRFKSNQKVLDEDVHYTISIVEQFHPDVEIGIKIISRTYANKSIQEPDGTIHREFPDELPVFKMFGYGWDVKPKGDGSIQ
jgi:hypothetical protein